MTDVKERHRRLRLFIKKLNKERKKQAKKIDILCNDFISAQRNFIKRLNTVSFTANFYESIIGTTDLSGLLYCAVKLIKEEFGDVNVTFFLRRAKNFELHIFEGAEPTILDKDTSAKQGQHIEDCFSSELMDEVCKSNKVCTLEDMFAMGLEGNLVGLNRIWAATVPLGVPGSSLGFILIWHSSEEGPPKNGRAGTQNKIATDELNNICAVTFGLSRAIQACQELLHSSD